MLLLKGTLGIVCLSLLSSLLVAQSSPITKTAPATPKPGGVLVDSNPMMPLIVPLFVEGDRFSSTLVLVNNATDQTYADLTLRGLDGKTLATQRVNFTPHSQRRVDIGKVLRANSSVATTGSIVIMPSSGLAGPAIGAMLAMTYTGSDPNYIDEEVSMPGMTGSRVLQGVADSGDGPPVLAISSLSEMNQHVQVQCLGKNGAVPARVVSLAAGETFITGACSGPDHHGSDVTAILRDTDEHAHGPQGIRLTSDGMPGSFAAFAMASHHARSDRFFSSVLFSDPKSLNSPNTVFTGVPVGDTSLLTAGRYVPQLTLTNFSAKDVHVHTTFAKTSRSTSAQEVGPVTVRANSTRELVLRNLNGDASLQNSFTVHSDGAPGVLMAKFVSRSESGRQGVELQAKDEADMENAGGHPWSIEQNTESTLLLFDHSTSSQVFTARVTGGGVDWQKEYRLASMQTKAISIRDLVEQRVKDDTGKVLPKGTISGETSWLVTDMKKASGRLLQSDRSTGMARNFSCGYSGLLCGVNMSIYQAYAAPNYLINYANITGYTCTSGLPNACSGARTGSANFTTSWWSNNTAIATIPGSKISPPVAVQGVKQGATTINGRLDSPYCSAGQSGPVTVKCFAQLKYRAVEVWIFEVGNHSYWWFQDGNGQNWVTDAGPTKNCINTSIDCGFLNSWATAGNHGQLPDDDAINNALAWQATPSASLCTNTGWLMAYQQQWRQNTVPYGKNKASNSNTFAHSSGSNAIFTITTPPPNAPGW
jgi:hypothetical protein